MSHDDPQAEPTPDFNELFKEELRLPQDPQAETPAERRRKLPPRLLPGHPERWDENAKYWAGLWLETLRDELSGSLRDAEQLAETCCEYARLCLLYGNAGEAIPLAKETLRRLAEQFGKDQLKAFNQIRRVYSRVFELAFGCRFHAEAIDFARFAKIADQPLWREGAMTVIDAAAAEHRLGEAQADGGLMMADARVVRPAAILEAWLEGTPVLSASVASIRRAGDRWDLLDAQGRIIVTADAVVATAGWGVEALLETGALSPVRGQADWRDEIGRAHV